MNHGRLLLASLAGLALACATAGASSSSEPRQHRAGYRDGNLAEHVKRRIDAGECKVVRTCGELEFVDCGIALDEVGYYLESETGEVLEVCGGACMAGPKATVCVACPPPEWTCD